MPEKLLFQVKLNTPVGFEWVDATDCFGGLCVVHRAAGFSVNASTREAKPLAGGYFVASIELGVFVSQPFSDIYDAVTFAYFLQSRHDWRNVTVKSRADFAPLVDLVRVSFAQWQENGGRL
jgi:hypothetical protein